jgi:hypothetical protein
MKAIFVISLAWTFEKVCETNHLHLLSYFTDLSHSDTRLSVMLNGFELHVYNRCEMYGNLEKLFGLEPQMFSNDEGLSAFGSGGVDSKKALFSCAFTVGSREEVDCGNTTEFQWVTCSCALQGK